MSGEVYEFRKIGTEEKLPYTTRDYTRIVNVPTQVKQPLWNSDNERLSIAELAALGLEILITPPKTQAELEYDHFTQIHAANPQLAYRVGQYKAYLDALELLVEAVVVVGTVTNGSAVISIPDFGDIKVIIGAKVTGAGIPADSVIASYTADSITLDKAATADGATIDITLHLTNYKATTDDIRTAIEALSITETEKLEMAQNINVAFHDILVNYQAVAAATAYAFEADDFTTWNGMDLMVYYLPSNSPLEPERVQPYVLTEE